MGIHAKTREFLDYFRSLELSSQCNTIRTDLAMLVTNKDVFSEVLTNQLQPSTAGPPYHLSPDDPEQIAVIKKLSNILYNLETLLSELEQLELTEDMYTVELAQHAPQVFKNTCQAINQIYDAIQLVNNSSASIQTMMPPQFEKLQEGCVYLCEKLSKFTSSSTWSGVEQTLGETIGETLSRLPTERTSSEAIDFFDLSKIATNIPGYIAQVQHIIKHESLFPEVQVDEAPEDYQRRVQKKAKSLASSLEKATSNTGLRQDWNMLSSIKKLNSITIELINTCSATTKEAYVKGVEKLDQLQFEAIPQMISELESLEENLGLKSGTLTEPALESAQAYYQQLANMVDSIPKAAKALDSVKEIEKKWYAKVLSKDVKIAQKEELPIRPITNSLINSSFVEKRQALQRERLHEAQAQVYETENSIKAADAFFKKVASINTFYNNGQFSSISAEEKQELALLYKQFQTQMAATNPKLDAKIVNYLNLTETEKEQLNKGKQQSSSILQSLWGGLTATKKYAQQMATIATSVLQGENEFKKVLGAQNKVIKSLQTELATQRQRVALIEGTQAKTAKEAQAALGGGSVLEVEAPLAQITKFKPPDKAVASNLHKQYLEFAYQTKKIDEAKNALAQFGRQLNAITDKNKTLSSISQEEKELLKAQFKKVQPYIRLLGEDDIKMNRLNSRIVNSLMLDKPGEGNEITIAQLLEFQAPIDAYLNQIKANNEEEQDKCTRLEFQTRKQSLSPPITLVPVGVTTKNSLLSQLSDMQLSTKVHDFLHENIIPYLQENLSADLLAELDLEEDLSELKPYSVAKEEASQISLYKNVINSFLHLEQALRAFEEKGQHEATESTISQALFLGTTGLSVGGAIYKASNAVSALQGNAQLEALLQQGMNIIAPMKQLPGVAVVFEKDPNKLITQAVKGLQGSMLNLVKNNELPYLHRRFIGVREQFIEQYASQINEAESALGLEKGSILATINGIFDSVEQQIQEELDDLGTTVGQITHPDWEEIAPLYEQLEETLKQDPLKKEDIEAIYQQLQPYLGQGFPDDFVSGATNTKQLIAITEQLLATEQKFNPEGALAELKNAFYIDDTDFNDEEAQQMFRTRYALLQPYLESMDPDYYNKALIGSLKTPKDYERVLTKIARDDGEKIVEHIKQSKTNSINSTLLSGAEQLQKVINKLPKEEKKPDPNKKIAETMAGTIYQLQHSLLHLVSNSNPLYLQEYYIKFKKEFMEQHGNQFNETEIALGLEKGSLATQLNRIFDDTEQQIQKELETLNLLLGGAIHPDWQQIEPLYRQLDEALDKDPVNKEEIEVIYQQLRGYLDEDFTEEFISSITEPQQLVEAVEQLLQTERIFAPVGSVAEIQNAYYYEELDFADEANRKMLRDHYDLLQPYLESIDPKHYSKTLIQTLETPKDYEELLENIAKNDSRGLAKKINQQHTNAMYSLMLSATHRLQIVSKEVQKAASQKQQVLPQHTAITQEEQIATVTPTALTQDTVVVSELPTSPPQKNESSSVLTMLIDGFYNLQEQASQLAGTDPAQVLKDKKAIENAIQAIKSSAENIKLNKSSITSFLVAINQLPGAIHNAGVESHQLVIDNLKNIRAQFGASIVQQADDAEFTLGLKPGTLSGPVSEHFDSFYKGLLDRTVRTSDQRDLELLIDTTPTEKRLEHEENRLKALLAKKPASNAEERSKEINIRQSQARIDYLTQLLESERNVKTPQKIEQFKEQKFDQQVKDILRESLGVYADVFFKEIKPSLKAMQEEILKDISIKDNIEDKIKASSLGTQFKNLMAEIITPQSPLSEHNAKLKQSYEGYKAANEQLLAIKEKKNYFEALMTDNLLINRIVKEIEQFEAQIEQFSKQHQPEDSLVEHQAMVADFINLIDKYKVFTTKSFQDQYSDYQDKKLDLLNTQNPIGKQKLQFMRSFEERILAFAKEHEPLEIMKEFEAMNSVAADYEKVMLIYDLNEKLITTLTPLTKSVNQSTPQALDMLKKLEFAVKMEQILLDPSQPPKDRLESAGAHLKSIAQPKPDLFDRIGIFFSEIIEKIRTIITGEKPEATKAAVSSFNKYKEKIHEFLPIEKEPIESDTPSLIEEQHHDLH